MDKLTTSQSQVTFARICVEVKADSPLPKSISFIDEEGTKHAQEVIYEWLPKMCSKCKVFGHNCLATQNPVVNQPKGPSAQASKAFRKQIPFSDKFTGKRPLRTNSPIPKETLTKNTGKQMETQKESPHQSHTKIFTASGQNKFALLNSLDSEDSVGALSPKLKCSPNGNTMTRTQTSSKARKISPQTGYSSEEENIENWIGITTKLLLNILGI